MSDRLADPGAIGMAMTDAEWKALDVHPEDSKVFQKLEAAGYDEFVLVVRKHGDRTEGGARLAYYSFFSDEKPNPFPGDLRRIAGWIESEGIK